MRIVRPETPQVPVLPLHLVEALAQVSVDYILEPHQHKRRVYARGIHFANHDHFTLLGFIHHLLDWYEQHSEEDLSEAVVRELVIKANTYDNSPAHILVPEVWNKLPSFYETVIQGGGYHEAWHTLWSHREPLDAALILREFFPKFPKRIEMNEGLHDFLGKLWNILEDIMIENRGVAGSPETRPIMCTIADHIQQLEQETRSFNDMTAASVFLGMLRDLGHGYNIQSVEDTLRDFTLAYPKLVEQFRENGNFYSYVERSQGLQTPFEVLDLFLDIWAKLVVLASQGEDPLKTKRSQSQGEEKGEGSGSGEGDETPKDAKLGISEICEEILDSATAGWVMHTAGSLIEHLIRTLNNSAGTHDLKPGEAKWNPISVEQDRVVLVNKGDFEATQKRLQEVQPVVAAIRTQLRRLFVGHRLPQRQDGLIRGKKITKRFLVETLHTLRNNQIPKRAFRAELPAPKQDLALGLLTDESGSMFGVRNPLIQAFLALAEAISMVGQQVFAVGIKDGSPVKTPAVAREGEFHRQHAVTYNIYVRWGEPFQVISQRFDKVSPGGGTPLGDGVHFVLEQLFRRPETFRILLVLTDGDPDPGQAPVIRHELRMAAKAGILVVGVGLGVHTGNLKNLFPQHVIITKTEDLPNLLMTKLYQLCQQQLEEPPT